MHIPTNPDFSSLNLAAAVQVLAYECRQAWLAEQEAAGETPRAEDDQRIHFGLHQVEQRIQIHLEQWEV